ncbi:MAG: stage IV sporulation protein A [Ruminococcaceae bacterium]|nr:stage IV sporulation protein A [Oscillospiraceae bacterium]
MEQYSIYNDIAQRTQGDIYIGVVGPVRTGKSTFIKRFMDLLVLPNIENEHIRTRAVDELPQSGSGRTIMTTEPKFIPNEAVRINVDENASFNVRMIDCVGYCVNGAQGHTEDGQPRMVTTPWFEDDIPFDKAAEIGTEKVIREHSTIGLVITTDGSICDIPRYEYVAAEERVVAELKEINKPFIILLNSAVPESDSAQNLKKELEKKYNVPVFLFSCADMRIDDINAIMRNVLFEFPLKELAINLPGWIDALPQDHYLKKSIYETVRHAINGVNKLNHIHAISPMLEENEYLSCARIEEISLGKGTALITTEAVEGLFYNVLGETTGLDINNDEELVSMLCSLSQAKKEYDKISSALAQVRQTGYGIVSPGIEELSLREPEIIRQGGRYGVRLRASAPSIHLIRADIETEVNPIVGSEKQSEELVHYLLSEFESDPAKIWESNIFGKSLHELVNEGLQSKLSKMPDDARGKLQETLQRIINEGSGGLICIIL